MSNINTRRRICQSCLQVVEGVCQGCARAREKRRPLPKDRGLGGKWQTISKRVLERDDRICWICGKPGADTADHVVRRRDGGSSHMTNLRAAHRVCNSRRG